MRFGAAPLGLRRVLTRRFAADDPWHALHRPRTTRDIERVPLLRIDLLVDSCDLAEQGLEP